MKLRELERRINLICQNTIEGVVLCIRNADFTWSTTWGKTLKTRTFDTDQDAVLYIRRFAKLDVPVIIIDI